MQWVYLSPHLDDVVLSCGGLVWEQTQTQNQVEIWTIFAGDPPPGHFSSYAEAFHRRWHTGEAATMIRRAEDQKASAILGATVRHFPFPDCIYRFTDTQTTSERKRAFLYTSDAALFGDIHPADVEIVTLISEELQKSLASEAVLVCPLALGNHVDHQLTRAALEKIRQPNWYYADYPYVLNQTENLAEITASGREYRLFPISSNGISAWVEAIAAYVSQISTFWDGLDKMRQAIEAYGKQNGGIRLWRRPSNMSQ